MTKESTQQVIPHFQHLVSFPSRMFCHKTRWLVVFTFTGACRFICHIGEGKKRPNAGRAIHIYLSGVLFKEILLRKVCWKKGLRNNICWRIRLLTSKKRLKRFDITWITAGGKKLTHITGLVECRNTLTESEEKKTTNNHQQQQKKLKNNLETFQFVEIQHIPQFSFQVSSSLFGFLCRVAGCSGCCQTCRWITTSVVPPRNSQPYDRGLLTIGFP